MLDIVRGILVALIVSSSLVGGAAVAYAIVWDPGEGPEVERLFWGAVAVGGTATMILVVVNTIALMEGCACH